MKNKRLIYLLLTIILFLTEVAIALFLNDNLIRPFVGDILVVILIYFCVRIFIPTGLRLLPLYVFVFACFIEFMQYLRIVELLGLSDNTLARTIIGTSFDWKDILCYGIGCLTTGILQKYFIKN